MAFIPTSHSPTELTTDRFGKWYAPHFAFGKVMDAAKAGICSLPTEEFTKQFFKLLKLQTTGNVQVDDGLIDALAPIELDELAHQYLVAETAIDYIDKKYLEAVEKEESAQERLKKVVSNIELDRQKSALDFAKKLSSMSLTGGLRASIIKTQNLINSPFAGLTGIKTMSEFLKPLDDIKTASDILNMGAGRQTGIIENRIPSIPEFVIPPNPASETNELLEKLSHGIERIVAITEQQAAIAEQQAAIFRSLAETANLSLAEAASSSSEAKKTTLITKRGVFIAIAALVVTITISGYQIWDAGQQSNKFLNTLEAIATEIGNQTKVEIQNGATMMEQIRDLKDVQNRPKFNLSSKARNKKTITPPHASSEH